jgi:hypothetical protein
VWLATDAALRAAVGEAEEGALPGHPHREGRALTECHRRVVADPTLRRPEDTRVLDPIAGKDADRAVVAADRNRNRERSLGEPEHLGYPRRDTRVQEGAVQLAECRPKERIVELGRQRRRKRICRRPGHAASLTSPLLRVFLDNQGEPVATDHPDSLSDVGSLVAAGLPELPLKPDLAQGTAFPYDLSHTSD